MNTNLISSYFKHLIKSKNEHSLHSPFIFDFYLKALKSKVFPVKNILSKYQKKLLRNNETLHVTDLGAGSKSLKTNERKVSDIAKSSASSYRKSRVLYNTLSYLNSKRVLELGTSLGVGTLNLSLPESVEHVITIEGCPNIFEFTRKQPELDNPKIEFIHGNIDNALMDIIEHHKPFDLIYFDGNHTEKATLEYFDICSKKVTDDSCFIFDDIYWSKGMKSAWKQIIQNPKVMLSIELFDFGIIFFRTNQPKQHFVLRA